MSQYLDALEAQAKAHLVQCGPCDFGLVEYGCTCPKGDPRPVISQLVELIAEVRKLRDQRDEAQAENRALNDAVEPFGDCSPDCDCGDHQRVCLCHVTGAEAREWIRREEARADQAEKERDQLREQVAHPPQLYQADTPHVQLAAKASRADLDAFERVIRSLMSELTQLREDDALACAVLSQRDTEIRLLREQRDKVLARLDALDEFGRVVSTDSAGYVTVSSVSSDEIRELLGAALPAQGQTEGGSPQPSNLEAQK